MQATWKTKAPPGVPWGTGDMDTALGQTIGQLYFKCFTSLQQSYVEADITSAVKYWVDSPTQNLGFLIEENQDFNKRLGMREATDPYKRPYLEVTYEAANDEYFPSPTGLAAKYYSGQTFVTWHDAFTSRSETTYRVYRSNQPITTENLDQAELIDTVYQGSSWISNWEGTFRQPDLTPAGVALDEDSGLYVFTVENEQNSYYAVTTVVEGNEQRRIEPGVNATVDAASEKIGLPEPFVYDPVTHYAYTGYVVWLGRFNPADLTDKYGYNSQRNAPFFFSIAKPRSYNVERIYPTTIYLHSAGHGYFDSTEGYDESLYVDSERYGGFCLGFADSQRVVARNAAGTSCRTGMSGSHAASCRPAAVCHWIG